MLGIDLESVLVRIDSTYIRMLAVQEYGGLK